MNWIVRKTGLQGDKEADAQEDTKKREGRGWGTNGEGERREREREISKFSKAPNFLLQYLPSLEFQKAHLCPWDKFSFVA